MNLLAIKLVSLCVFAGLFHLSTAQHKYDLEIQKISKANNTDFVVFEGLKVKRLNRTCKFDVSISLNHKVSSALSFVFLSLRG